MDTNIAPDEHVQPQLMFDYDGKRDQWNGYNPEEHMKIVEEFILGGSKITADGDCSHEIKRHLLLGRKVMTNLDSIFKSRDINFANKGPSSQGYGFSSSHVWM